MSNIYLQVEFGSGKAYEYSKTEKEGFDKFESKEGKSSWRKYYNKGVYGVYKGSSVRSSPFGDNLSIHMIDLDSNNVYLSFNLFDQKGAISIYASSVISYLGGLTVGSKYRVYPYAIENESSDWKTRGVSVKYSNEDLSVEQVVEDDKVNRLSFSYYKGKGADRTLIEGEVPAEEWTQKMGKNVKNTDAKDEFLYNFLMKNSTDSRGGSSNIPQEDSKKVTDTQPKEPQPKEPQKKVAEYDDDDLPF